MTDQPNVLWIMADQFVGDGCLACLTERTHQTLNDAARIRMERGQWG